MSTLVRRQPEEYNFKTMDFDERILPANPDRTTYPRRQKISFVVLHHMAMPAKGETAITACLNAWKTRAASAHYLVADQFIAQAVWDNHEAWATANSLGNQAGISIEHANSTAGPTWQISTKTLLTGAKLVAGLHIFHKLGRPVWGKTLFQHRNFYNTACAGPYLGDAVLPQYVAEAQHQYDLMVLGADPVPELPIPPAPVLETYTVVHGDTLYVIARRYGVTVAELVKWNNITNPNAIEVGQVLRVKAPTGGIPPVTQEKPLPDKIRITDSRIQELSGLVLSVKNPGCYWACNDENGRIWLVRISDGAIVGSVILANVTLEDEECLAIDYATKELVVIDGGNNKGKRKTGYFYAIPEPVGEKHHGAVAAVRTAFAIPDKANFEACIIHPKTSVKHLISKADVGHIYEFTGGKLRRLSQGMPKLVTDACYSPTGENIYMVRKDVDVVEIYDASTFLKRTSIPHPDQPQPETIALYPNGIDVVVGSEGKGQSLKPVRIPAKYL